MYLGRTGAYKPGRSQCSVDIEEADGVLERTVLEGDDCRRGAHRVGRAGLIELVGKKRASDEKDSFDLES